VKVVTLGPKPYLLTQIDALEGNLSCTSRVMESTRINSDLRTIVQGRFETKIRNMRKEIKSLRDQVNDDKPLDLCWNSFFVIRQECIPLLRECLDFLEGALIRSAELDGGICQVADRLLNDLERLTYVKWAGLTIMGDKEYFDQTANIIRIRFPDFNIWSLPITAHEFGHLIEFELKEQSLRENLHPVREIIRKEGIADPRIGFYMRELFCDLFGVYTIGPAFACASLILNFNPLKACDDGVDHPSYAKRVYFILKALEKMNAEEPTKPYQDIITKLNNLWMDSAGPNGQLNPKDVAQLDYWLDELYFILDKHLPPKVKYPARSMREGWLVAQGWFGEWDKQLEDDQDISIPQGPLDGQLRDVLNAAWLCRIHKPEKAREITKAAQKLCKVVKQI
jgi:hypothetical protein